MKNFISIRILKIDWHGLYFLEMDTLFVVWKFFLQIELKKKSELSYFFSY